MADSPHPAYPLRLTARGAITVDDGTLDDLAGRALFILRTPLGWRPEAPDYGTTDPLFELVNRIEPRMLQQITASDPAIGAAVRQDPQRLADGVSRILVTIQRGT